MHTLITAKLNNVDPGDRVADVLSASASIRRPDRTNC